MFHIPAHLSAYVINSPEPLSRYRTTTDHTLVTHYYTREFPHSCKTTSNDDLYTRGDPRLFEPPKWLKAIGGQPDTLRNITAVYQDMPKSRRLWVKEMMVASQSTFFPLARASKATGVNPHWKDVITSALNAGCMPNTVAMYLLLASLLESSATLDHILACFVGGSPKGGDACTNFLARTGGANLGLIWSGSYDSVTADGMTRVKIGEQTEIRLVREANSLHFGGYGPWTGGEVTSVRLNDLYCTGDNYHAPERERERPGQWITLDPRGRNVHPRPVTRDRARRSDSGHVDDDRLQPRESREKTRPSTAKMKPVVTEPPHRARYKDFTSRTQGDDEYTGPQRVVVGGHTVFVWDNGYITGSRVGISALRSSGLAHKSRRGYNLAEANGSLLDRISRHDRRRVLHLSLKIEITPGLLEEIQALPYDLRKYVPPTRAWCGISFDPGVVFIPSLAY